MTLSRPEWSTAHPRASGPWTVRCDDQWGLFDPERGRVEPVDPSTDPRLPGLPGALEKGRLVGYRHGRRAIVATPMTFIKIVRPSRIDALVERHSALAEAASCFDVPAVLDAKPDGRVELQTMTGRSLHQRLRDEPACAVDDIGAVVAGLHAQPVSPHLPVRRTDDPQTWVAISRRAPTTHLPAIERTAASLPPLEARDEVMVHGDLHDKNIFCAEARRVSGRPALIDLDGLGLGAPEDDIANLAVHLELRNIQAGTGLSFGHRASELYRGYQDDGTLDERRLAAVERHTWFRLACIYQYRAASYQFVPLLLEAAYGSTR